MATKSTEMTVIIIRWPDLLSSNFQRFYSVATPIRVYTVTKPSVPMGMRVWLPALKTMYPEGILSSERLLGMC